MATRTVSLDLEAATLDQLAERERATGESQSQLAQRYIEEGLRMERHPGIVFRDGPTGRRAALISGPDAWEVMAGLRDADLSRDAAIEAEAAWLEMPESLLRTVLGYYAEFREEIDDRIDRNRALGAKLEAAWRAERGLPPE